MTSRYLYVLGSYAGSDPAARKAGDPAFEFHRFVADTGADVVSLSTLGVPGSGTATRLTSALLVQRLRLAALVARRARDYDAIIASGEDIGVFVALALRATRCRTPLVMVTHGPQFASPKFRAVLSLVRSMPNVVFACLSASLAERLIATHGLDPRRCQATGYGIDTDYFASEPGETEPMVASAGTSNRDYDTLVEAVTGTGIDTRIAAYSTWVGAAGDVKVAKPDHVEMRSYGNYANLRDLYRRARAVVVPTHDVDFAAGFAVIAEAMATGTPVIATRGRVVSDFVVEGETGLLVPPGDAQALREAIRTLVDRPEFAGRLGAAGAAAMRERYSLARYVQRLRAAADSVR